MAVPVAMPHMADSRTHQRYLFCRTDSRIPNASGKRSIHCAVSTTPPLSVFAELLLPVAPVLLARSSNVEDDDDDDDVLLLWLSLLLLDGAIVVKWRVAVVEVEVRVRVLVFCFKVEFKYLNLF